MIFFDPLRCDWQTDDTLRKKTTNDKTAMEVSFDKA